MKKIEKYLYIVSPLLILASLIYFYLTRKFEIVSIAILVAGVGIGILFFLRFYDDIVQKITKRKVRYGANSMIITFVVVALAVIVYLVLFDHNKKFDLTTAKRFSLSDQTERILENLKGPVKVYAFYSKNQDTGSISQLLKQYHYIYKDLDYEIIDPDLNPGKAQEMNVESYGDVIIEYEGKREKVKSASEEGITNALIKLTQQEIKRIYFITGHGERSVEDYGQNGYDRIKAAITAENYDVEELLLFRVESIPDDCAVLVSAGPTSDYDTREITLIENYIKEGGRVIFLLDPSDKGIELTNITLLLEKYGLIPGKDIIIDPLSRMFSGDFFMPVVNDYTYNPITRDFRLATFFRLARSIQVKKQDAGGNIFTRIVANTGDSSWAETNLKGLFLRKETKFDKGVDLKGPVPVMAYSQITISEDDDKPAAGGETKEAYVLAVGDSDFITNSMYKTQGNKDLFLNAINFLADRGELISIRPSQQESVYLTLTAKQGRLAFFISMVTIPLLVIIVGLYINIQRRVKS
jgi:hypothetical protein